MFIILVTYKVSMEEVLRILPSHRQFLDKYYQKGNLIASGPQVPRTGGVILLKADNRTEVEQIILEDPFYIHEIADYHITEFEANKYTSEFEALLK